jgi:hypothetical protein
MDWIEFEMTIDIMVPKIECKKIDLILYLVYVFTCVFECQSLDWKKTYNITIDMKKIKLKLVSQNYILLQIWFRDQFYWLIISRVAIWHFFDDNEYDLSTKF